MSVAVAAGAAIGIFLIVAPGNRTPLAKRVADYLQPQQSAAGSEEGHQSDTLLEHAGLAWNRSELLVRRSTAAFTGALAGALVSQGDLFLESPSRAAPALIVLGGAAGWLLFGMWLSTRRQRRITRLRFELPVAADAMGLHVLAGESIATSVEHYVASTTGVVAEDLARALERHRNGTELADSLLTSGSAAAHPDARRLNTLLGHAHRSGGRLADSLAELATDQRSALARDATSESGRRAIASYGPILALVVPVTLIFLLYPTLTSLRELAAGP